MLAPQKPTSTCPECGSIYLLRQGVSPNCKQRKTGITLSERFLCLTIGLVVGLFTFFFWGIALLVNGGPAAGKAVAGALFVGLKLSLALSVFVGLAGFILGQDRLAQILGMLWGTDRDINDKLDRSVQSLQSVELDIPNWVAYVILGVVILGVYGYAAVML